ncbi:olfactory receptor 6N1-like [Hyperolius riggenbachi]|uniref:olfactory receptor 6N1-like n=1 Tax=Hyperolius riggenbachi TaxID=752182 RepID=UPI0035A36663
MLSLPEPKTVDEAISSAIRIDRRLRHQRQTRGSHRVRVTSYAAPSAATLELINEVFREVLGRFVVVYLDDILIFSNNLSEHRTHVKFVLNKLRQNSLYAKLEKCIFEANKDNVPWSVSGNVTVTHVTEFIIFGFPSLQKYHIMLFCVFLCIYLFTLSGNGIIFFLVTFSKHLKTPMYFFVFNLSFLDMSYSSVTIPKMLAKFLMNLDTISYNACFAQMYIFLSLVATECLLLTLMAYDRYLAICSPLHYPIIMTKKLYLILAAVVWIGGFATPLTALILALRLPFCGPNIIHHYYCDHPPLLQLACANTSLNVTVGSSFAAFIVLISFTLIVISYVKIIIAIFKISSQVGRKKTFSTCASHFAVVNVFFLPLIFMYIRPTASYSSDVDSLVAMLYTVLTPMMNPIIYSLRNKDIKDAFLKKISCKCIRMNAIKE